MIFITEKQIKLNLKKYGFKTVKGDFTEVINNIVYNFVYNVTSKTAKKLKLNKNNNNKLTLTLSHFKQLGGRVSLPSEYFGVPSNHYVSESKATDMSVTSSYIRPEMLTYRPGIVGGAEEKSFVISLKNVKAILSEVLVKLDLTDNVKKQDHTKISAAFKAKLEDHLHKMFTSYVKKSSVKKQEKQEADSKDFESKVLSIKKYALYVRKI